MMLPAYAQYSVTYSTSTSTATVFVTARSYGTVLPLFYITCRCVPGPPVFLRLTLKSWAGPEDEAIGHVADQSSNQLFWKAGWLLSGHVRGHQLQCYLCLGGVLHTRRCYDEPGRRIGTSLSASPNISCSCLSRQRPQLLLCHRHTSLSYLSMPCPRLKLP